MTADRAATADTFPALLAANAARLGDRPAYREKEFGIWQVWSWARTAAEVEALGRGLLDLGMAPGDHVAIVGRNRPHLYWAMVAAQAAGAVPVPVYKDAAAEEMGFVLADCDARFAVVEDQEQVDKLLEAQDRLPALAHVVYVDPRGLRRYDHTRLHAFADVVAAGRADTHGAELARRRDALTGGDACVMLYTSGTTGRPKGVVLTHDNMLKIARAAGEVDRLRADDSILAYLPLAWVGDFAFSMAQAHCFGFSVNCPESEDTMQADLREIGPTYFFAPPRFFEGLLTSVSIRMEDAGATKRWLYSRFMAVADRVGRDLLDGRAVEFADRLLYALGEVLVYGPLKDTLGLGRVRVAYTAGEAIGPDLFDFYRSIGINLKQLYGQTEASVFITQQVDGDVRVDTVGPATPGVELRIAEGGEVYYRSPGVFREYFKNPEATAKTKDADGWVATGDAGVLEEGTGHLKIIDRAKDVGRLATGALFAPKYIENKLKFFPNILEAVVFGADRPMCCAFVNIDLGAVGNWAERNNISYASYQELAAHARVYAMIQDHVEKVNESLAADDMLAGCQIHRFLILHKELDADDGELTRTRKVRRNTVAEKYADLIEALYSGQDSISTETEVTYEDGRKGTLRATLEIRDARLAAAQPAMAAQ